MKYLVSALRVVVVLAASTATLLAQEPMPEHLGVIIPKSSIERFEDFGKRARTNHLILARSDAGYHANVVNPAGETPDSIRSAYKLPATGGVGVIAIVDAYDDPNAENDLTVFSGTFGLPECTTANGCFQKVFASGSRPSVDCGWAQEASLDIEWAHAMAPGAKIVLVEAASNASNDLASAVDVANAIVSAGGKGFGEVSMSWGFTEFSGETGFDQHFRRRGVVYFASSGDVGGKRIYPGTSPQVVSVGGTTLHRDSAGHLISETGWSGSGGGPSQYEPRPHYQDVIVRLVGTQRGAPDVSFNADPSSGVAVYDSTACQGMSGWLVFGGTSLSAPAMAGVVNVAGHFFHSSDIELSTMYSTLGSGSFRDITRGTAGTFSAKKGWDFVTGIGSPIGLNGK